MLKWSFLVLISIASANGFIVSHSSVFLRSSRRDAAMKNSYSRRNVPSIAWVAQVGTAPQTTRDLPKSDLRTQLIGAKKAIAEMIDKTNANPLLVRLAWHDAGTFDASINQWPRCGGAIGSIRFSPEITHGANAGLANAVNLLEPIKKKFPLVSYADLFQMASATAIELCGGPKIPMRYGRVDARGSEDCSPEGNLPWAEPNPQGVYGTDTGTKPTVDTTPGGHLRKVFYRMGLDDKDIVALSGAHTIGRAWKDRSGLGKESTKFTKPEHIARADGKPGIGKPGGQPWTEKWLKFDNSYFTVMPDPNADPELLKLSTDRIIFNDEGFKPYADKYKASQDVFFADYAQSHAKLSELGSKFSPAEGIKIDGVVKAKVAVSPYSVKKDPWDL